MMRKAGLRWEIAQIPSSCNCRHSGPQGRVEPLTIIDDPADWKAADFEVNVTSALCSLAASL